MKHSKSYFWLILSLFIVVYSCSDDDAVTTIPEDEQQSDPIPDPEPLPELILLDQSYGDDPQQIFDLYLPEGRSETTTKVVVLVHGGGWIQGDKSDMTEFVQLVRENHPDHAVVNMNYVLATTAIPAFPNQFLDIDRLIDHVSERFVELQILPEFGLIGTSAGAHISLQYDYVYDNDDQVKFVGDIVGPTDFTDPFYADDPSFGILLSILVDESAYPPGTDFARAVSPALQVGPQSSPTIMFYGDMDPLVPLSNGQTLRDALTNSSITNSFTLYNGGHGDDWSEADRLDLQQKLSGYIENYLPIN